MKRLAFMASLLAGCGFEVSGGAGIVSDDDPIDAGTDTTPDMATDANVVPTDTAIGDTCIGGALARVCFATPPTGQKTFTAMVIDTGDSNECVATTNAEAAGWCVVAAANIAINAGVTVRGIGERPLVLVASSAITIGGGVDVGSRGLVLGAGGNSALCATGTPAGSGNSSGGGFGGSFGGRGGNGNTNDGGSGGVPPSAVTGTLALRGGCRGNNGGPLATSVAAGGNGGGALALIAGASITLQSSAEINASGAGGRVGSVARQGGGGGGSGGMVLLEAPAIIATGAVLYANGGGGAEGNGATLGNPGQDVANASSSAPGGENGTSFGGDGGDGSLGGAGFAAPDNASDSGGGGGGGGGGTGVVHSTVALTGATTSPARTP